MFVTLTLATISGLTDIRPDLLYLGTILVDLTIADAVWSLARCA